MSETRTRKIVLTADDYGACDFIDNAILAALDERRINSVACFVTHAGSKERIQQLAQLQRDRKATAPFGIGLHFSLTSGAPAANHPAGSPLVENGLLRDAYNYPVETAPLPGVREELKAQVRLLDAWLKEIDPEAGIDSVSNHHGLVYMDDRLFHHYLTVSADFGLPIRSPWTWFRSHLRHLGHMIPPIAMQGVKLRLLEQFSDIQPNDLRRRQRDTLQFGCKTTYCLADVIYGQPSVRLLEHLVSQYERNIMSTEFMFHLGVKNENDPFPAGPPGIDPGYFPTRIEEFESLRQMALPELLERFVITPVTFQQLDLSDAGDPC